MPALLLQPDAALVDSETRACAVRVEDGTVRAVGDAQQLDPDGRCERRELSGTLIPGLIDLQVNGAAGRGVDEAVPEALDAIAEAVLTGGASAFLPTLISAPLDRMLEQTASVADWVGGYNGPGARPLGIHLEGPFLESPGAHDPTSLGDPTPERVAALLEAAGGHLAMVTLAPGRAGALEATRQLTEAGVCVSIGHATDTSQFAACVDAGATMVTHLFNAMSPVRHRDPGIASLALDEQRLSCSMILDGVHVDEVAVRMAWRCLGPARTVLVTDCMAAAGMPDGEYDLGGSPVQLDSGVVRDSAGRLAGSAILMSDAVQGLQRFVPEAGLLGVVSSASTNPARLLGDDTRGHIAPGALAEFGLVDLDGGVSVLRLGL